MWEGPTIGNPMGLYILTIISSSAAIIASLYGFFIWIRRFFIKRFAQVDERLEKMDERFEMLDNRIFQLAMGKSLKEIMLEERGEG